MATTSDQVIEMLINRIESLGAKIDANHQSSEGSRRRLHEEQNQLRIALVQLDHKVDTGNRETTAIKDRLEKAEQVASEINTWRERITGMKMVLVGQWIFVAFVVGGALTIGWRWVQAKLGL